MRDIQTVILGELKYIRGRVDELATTVAALKVKSGVWGTIGGAVVLLIWVCL